MTDSSVVADWVRGAVARGAAVQDAIATEVRRANERALRTTDSSELAERDVSLRVEGFGVFQPLLDDPSIEEIWVNGTDAVFVARSGRHERLDLAVSAEETRALVERMLRQSRRRIDYSQPFVDASLPDGSRLHVVIPPITRGAWSVNIRKFSRTLLRLDDLVGSKTLPKVAANLLSESIRSGATILVSGATQAGKTTMLAALCGELPDTERIVTVEETFELALANTDVVGLQCRGPSLEGTGEVTLRRLVRETLRMRPTRIVVGEVRGDEALDLLVALNSGIPGLCTIHANGTGDAIRKLATLCQIAGGVSAEFVSATISATVDLVVHCRMDENGRRRVTDIARPQFVDGRIETESVWSPR
ncbi:MAG: hypothetical protein RLZ72_609 [Actinomycetota bacterium]